MDATPARDPEQPTEPPARTGSSTSAATHDVRDAHAVRRTYESALRTVFQVTFLGVTIGRLFSTVTSVLAALFIVSMLILLAFAASRHSVNGKGVRRGVIRVDGISPIFFFVLGLASTAGAAVYSIQRFREVL